MTLLVLLRLLATFQLASHLPAAKRLCSSCRRVRDVPTHSDPESPQSLRPYHELKLL